MNGNTDAIERARMAAFNSMTPNEQRRAIRQMADAGYGPNIIASATGFSKEMVYRILATTQEANACQTR